MAQYDFDEKESEKATSVVGLMAVVIVALLGFGAWFFYMKDDVKPPAAISTTVEKAKDAAAEVPQAAKDATTKGDQDTTRPNKDGSTDKLDQK